MGWFWFQNKKSYPKFWETYLQYFSKSNSADKPIRYVIFDTETTGLHPGSDVILSLGAVTVVNNHILVNEALELFLKQDKFTPETVPIHGILQEGNIEKVVEAEAVIRFVEFIKDAVLVGHHIAFDVAMINQALKRLGAGKLKNEKMDTDALYRKWKGWQDDQHTGLDELCKVFKIPKEDRHTALGDAYITAIVFLKLKQKLKIDL
jgi:DNA polymerase III subunit epsilon